MDDVRYIDPKDDRIIELSTWLIQEGLRGTSRTEMLKNYCHELIRLGVPLFRANITQSALHPVYGAIGFNWQKEEGHEEAEYAHTERVPDNWIASPFYHMIKTAEFEYRERMHTDGPPSQFPLLNEMVAEGATDYFAMVILFEDWSEVNPDNLEEVSEGALMSWMADRPGGFTDEEVTLIRETASVLSLVLKSGTHRKTAEDLLGIYLGRDAGRRVLSGEIQRGSTRWIDAVIYYFDLEGFTQLSQQLEGEELIAMLNDYFARVVAQIETEGGNILKFMGDGLLAIFDREFLLDAPDRALRATRAIEKELAALGAARQESDLHTFSYTIALHSGRVLYGNIGADERLDFTVIGPAVNLAARIGGMHKALGQRVVLSGAFAEDVTDASFDLVSLGRYMLRGVANPQELFTIYTSQTADLVDAKEG